MVAQAVLSRVVRAAARRLGVDAAAARFVFLLVLGTVFVGALHGVNTLKIGAIALVNYGLARSVAWLPRRVVIALLWAFHGGVLFLVFSTEGVPWHTLAPQLAWLDDYSGLIRRWHISYNFAMLRMLSFALDSVEAHTTAEPPGPTSAIQRRMRTPHPLPAYSMASQWAYLSYPPLLIAGPIMTFNDFQAQRTAPLPIKTSTALRYGVRCAVSWLMIEFMLHYMYVNAIKAAHAWDGYTPMQLALLGFWSLQFVWLKLCVPWRVFRWWALLDGVDAPENMVRAITNSPSALLFWRAWHRSYNLWVVRYIYIPMGGARRQVWASLVVFTFVALWHDLSFTLLAWAWLVVLFIVPELVGRALVPASRYGNTPWFPYVRALGTVVNVFMMMTANLVGFVVGLDGIQFLWSQLIGTPAGWLCLGQLVTALFIAAQLMWEYRTEEKRRGIVRNC